MSQFTGGGTVDTNSGGTVTGVSGTANQITSSGGNSPVLSLPNPLIAPGAVTLPTTVTRTGQFALITTPSAIANTETIVAQSPVAMAAARLVAGTVLEIIAEGTYIAAGAANCVWRIRIGPLGTLSDPAALSVTGPASAAGGPIAFRVSLDMTVRSIGSGTSATCVGQYFHINSGTTGLAATVANTAAGTPAGFDTTTANFITLSFISGNASNNATFTQAYGTFLNL